MIETEQTIQRTTAPDFLRVYFFAPDNSFMSRAVSDYHKIFDYNDAFVSHCALQLGNQVYEVSLEGTTVYDYTEELDSHPRLLSYYELEIDDKSEDSRYAAEFLLRSYVQENRKLDWRGCLKYAANFLLLSKGDRMLAEYHNFNAPASSIQIKKSKANTKMLVYNLPYTCATQVIYVLCYLLDVEPLCVGHLPMSVYEMLAQFHELEIGVMWTDEKAFELGE